MATSIIINATDADGKAVSKSYSDLKTDATDAELRDFATKINAFSDHTLDKIFRVDKKDITKDDAPVDPNFTISPTTCKYGALGFIDQGKAQTISLSYDGPKRKPILSGKKTSGTTLIVTEDTITYGFEDNGGDLPTEDYLDNKQAVMTITLPATDGYLEASATFTVTHVSTDSGITDI